MAQDTAHPALRQLEPLVGEWRLANEACICGLTNFAWLKGQRFLVQRWTVERVEIPDGVAIIGADTSRDSLVQHHFDSRGVRLTYTRLR